MFGRRALNNYGSVKIRTGCWPYTSTRCSKLPDYLAAERRKVVFVKSQLCWEFGYDRERL